MKNIKRHAISSLPVSVCLHSSLCWFLCRFIRWEPTCWNHTLSVGINTKATNVMARLVVLIALRYQHIFVHIWVTQTHVLIETPSFWQITEDNALTGTIPDQLGNLRPLLELNLRESNKNSSFVLDLYLILYNLSDWIIVFVFI